MSLFDKPPATPIEYMDSYFYLMGSWWAKTAETTNSGISSRVHTCWRVNQSQVPQEYLEHWSTESRRFI